MIFTRYTVQDQKKKKLTRIVAPSMPLDDGIEATVQEIVKNVRVQRDEALIKYAERFDGAKLSTSHEELPCPWRVPNGYGSHSIGTKVRPSRHSSTRITSGSFCHTTSGA